MVPARRFAPYLVALGGLALGAYFILRGRGVKQFADRMSFRITPNLSGLMVRSDYLTVPVTLTVANRSAEQLGVRIHSVKLKDAGGEVGDVQASTGSVLHAILPHAETNIPIRMNLPTLTTLARLGMTLTQGVIGSLGSGGFKAWLERFAGEIKQRAGGWFTTLSVYLAVEVDGIPYSTTLPLQGGGLSLGLVSTRKRPIGPKSDYAHLVPALRTVRVRSTRIMRGTTSDTAALIRAIAKRYAPDVRRLATSLRGESVRQTLANIYAFVYRYVAYERDAASREEVRTPLRTLHDQRGDCDCYSTLIASLLEALRIPYAVRLAAYKGRGYFQHVYVVVYDPEAPQGYWTIDPVVEGFNYEEPYTYHRDF